MTDDRNERNNARGREFRARQRAKGLEYVRVWLPAELVRKMDDRTERHSYESRAQFIQTCIRHYIGEEV